MRNPGITRHMRDLERLKTIQAVVDRELRPGRAAERLGSTVPQIERHYGKLRSRHGSSCETHTHIHALKEKRDDVFVACAKRAHDEAS